MDPYLWKISKEKLNKTNLFLYSNFIKKNFKIDVNGNFNDLWKWSVDNPKIFWKSIWDFTKVKGHLGNILLEESNIFFENKFLPKTPLTFVKSQIDFQNFSGLSMDHFQILLKS